MCGKCIEKCEKKCIDFNMSDEDMTFKVGTIIVATGMEVYDPTEMDEYGYTRHENVVTSPEFERLDQRRRAHAGRRRSVRPTASPRSRSPSSSASARAPNGGASPTARNVCCMETVKNTLLLKEHDPDLDVKVFYIDIRAFGKGFEDLFRRSRGAGVRYIRGLPGSVREDPKSKDLILTVENTATNQLEKHRAEMVVLAVGVKPPEDMKAGPGDAGPPEELRRLLPRGSPQASACGFGDPGDLLRRLRRGTQGHQGFGHAGLGRRCPGDAPDESAST